MRPILVKPEVVDLRLLELRRQRANAERERVPTPVDRLDAKHSTLEHVPGLRAWFPHCVQVFGYDTMSPESIVKAAAREGSSTPGLTDASVDSST